jgi:hypothetical protein
MKSINSYTVKYLFILVIVFLTQIIHGQPEFSDGDNVADVPAAPINNWIILTVVFVLVSFYIYYIKLGKNLASKFVKE